MCAKIRTKKAKLSTKEAIDAILKSHGIDLDESVKEPLLDDLIEYLNNVFKPSASVPHWTLLVSHYLKYYENLTNEKPAFNGMQAQALKKLSKILMDRYMTANKEGIWSAEVALRQHQIFYDSVCTLDFYKRSFTVALCYNSFDTIKAQLSNRRQKQKEIDDKILA